MDLSESLRQLEAPFLSSRNSLAIALDGICNPPCVAFPGSCTRLQCRVQGPVCPPEVNHHRLALLGVPLCRVHGALGARRRLFRKLPFRLTVRMTMWCDSGTSLKTPIHVEPCSVAGETATEINGCNGRSTSRIGFQS